ncbi:hypothetical protein VTK73DRAFT_2579 [Phialemonium thermophilum]|uniref:Protein kinase domain-containing protein n=1 Tax=Phialemonium thermophilum TaxID=223376 RepID=A0ABR3X4E9_9PEZI
MSVVPYHSRESREIVLRHHNAIVYRDPASQRLEIRGSVNECPTCHRPIRSPSPERHYEVSSHTETYVDPDYFRMLRPGSDYTRVDRPPSSPIRRLVEPIPSGSSVASGDAEFISSSPVVSHEGSRIRKEAFSPNYFNTFFTEERELGRGGKGVVLLVRHEIDGCHLGHFACKRVPVGDDHAWLEKVLTEVELLARLTHPNLVSYRHVWLEDVKLNRFGPSVACAFILQQYCNGGDLHHYVLGDQPRETTKEELKARMRRRSKGQTERPPGLSPGHRYLPFEEIYSLFRDITSGLAYLHGANYIHRDLKPSNCLLHREGSNLTCLISDFGEVQPENVARLSTGSTGTVSYCAPEVLKKDSTGRYGNFTTKSDIFSLGMILYFMCFGRLPYRSANSVQEELEDIDQLRAEISNWKGFHDEKRERPDLPPKLYQLLKRLLAVDPRDRPSANEVLSAMKGESNLDAFPLSGRSSSPSIGRRIQNLDSPAPPSTPTRDPTKHARVSSIADEDVVTVVEGSPSQERPTSQYNLRRHVAPGIARRRSHALASSNNHEGFIRGQNRQSSSQSPERGRQSGSGNGLGSTSLGVARDRVLSPGSEKGGADAYEGHVDGHLTHIPRSPSSESLTPPLLMPPPRTFFGEVRHRALLLRHHVGEFVLYHEEQIVFSVRLGLFLIKMGAIARSCWPYSVDWGVGAGLVAVAALDLGPSERPLLRIAGSGAREAVAEAARVSGLERSSGVTHNEVDPSAIHGGPLRNNTHRLGGNSLVDGALDLDAGGVEGPRGHELSRIGLRSPGWRRPTRWWWDWRASCLLLVLHFLVLWVTSRYGALCAAKQESWPEW